MVWRWFLLTKFVWATKIKSSLFWYRASLGTISIQMEKNLLPRSPEAIKIRKEPHISREDCPQTPLRGRCFCGVRSPRREGRWFLIDINLHGCWTIYHTWWMDDWQISRSFPFVRFKKKARRNDSENPEGLRPTTEMSFGCWHLVHDGNIRKINWERNRFQNTISRKSSLASQKSDFKLNHDSSCQM